MSLCASHVLSRVVTTSSFHGNPTLPWEGNISYCEKTKTFLSPPKPPVTDHRPPLATVRCQPPPPSTATASRCPSPSPLSVSQWPPPPSRVFLEIYQIFPRIQFIYQTLLKYHARESYSENSIPGNPIPYNKNSFCLPNTHLM